MNDVSPLYSTYQFGASPDQVRKINESSRKAG